MTNWIARLAFFLSAYSPLLIMLGVRSYYLGRGSEALGYVLFAVVGLVLSVISVLSIRKHSNVRSIRIKTAVSNNAVYVTYLSTYVLPVGYLLVESWSDAKVSLILVYLALLGIVHLRSGLFAGNPFLLVAGYHIYQVTTYDRRALTLLSKGEILSNDRLLVYQLSFDTVFRSERPRSELKLVPKPPERVAREYDAEMAELEPEAIKAEA